MRMSEFIIREAISANLSAQQKEGIIREMVENLRNAGYFKGSESDDVVKAILKRELLSSTGIGDSVAIPHAAVEGLTIEQATTKYPELKLSLEKFGKKTA